MFRVSSVRCAAASNKLGWPEHVASVRGAASPGDRGPPGSPSPAVYWTSPRSRRSTTRRRRLHVHDAPLSRPGGRLLVPVSRIPRDALSHQLQGTPHRRRVRHDEHAQAAGGGGAARARGGGIRRQGQDLPRRSVPRVQGQPSADADGIALPDRVHPRHRARAGVPGAGGGGSGGPTTSSAPSPSRPGRRGSTCWCAPATRTWPSSWTSASRWSTPWTTRSSTRPESRPSSGCRRSPSSTTWRSSAIRWTTSRGSRRWDPRPPRSGSPSTGRSRTSSPTPATSRARSGRACGRASRRFRSRRSW